MKTIMRISGRNLGTVRRRRLVKGGLATILATGLAPGFARAEAKKLVMAHIIPPPDSGAVGFAWQAEEVRKRSGGELDMQFFGGTLLSKELEIMNAVKAGNIQIGDPAGAAATVFPEMGVFLVPYLVQSYDHAYKMFNGKIGDALDKLFQEKYKLKTLCFFDYGFRHFWTSKKPIVEPKDLRGAKIRVQLAKVFADTINGLGGNAVPMAWGEVITAAKSGVIDGGDLPIVNQLALKIYEVSKYCSMTFHNYGPTLNTMNLATWESLSPQHKKLMLETSREAQDKIRQLTETVDNFAAAKAALEPKGMTVVEAKVEEFRKVAQQKIWPAYKAQFGELWGQIEGVKA
jgi:tripartite ATP-independent transporter DctP family solute receptor